MKSNIMFRRMILPAALMLVLVLGLLLLTCCKDKPAVTDSGPEESVPIETPYYENNEAKNIDIPDYILEKAQDSTPPPSVSPSPTVSPSPMPEDKVKYLSAIKVTVKEGIYGYDIAPAEPYGNVKTEFIKLDFKLDGHDETLNFSIKTVEGVIYLNGIGSDDRDSRYDNITRVGQKNRFVFAGSQGLVRNLYMVDLESMIITEVLPHEDSGYTREEFTELYGHINWAINPCISPDGKLMVYTTDRFGYRDDIRVYNFETGEDKTVAEDMYFYNGMTVWTSNTNLIYKTHRELYNLNLSENAGVRYICQSKNAFEGYYHNILYNSEIYELTWINCETGGTATYKFSDRYPKFNINESTERPAAAIIYNEGNKARLALLRFGTGELIDVFSLDEADGGGMIKWIDENTLVWYDTFNGGDKTYYLDVSELLAAPAAEFEKYTAEAEDLFPKPSPYPEITDEPIPVPTERPDYSGECKIAYNGKIFKVEGNYTDSELTGFFGEPLSEETTTKVQGDMPQRHHYRTLTYDGLILSAYQLASYPPDVYGESWQVSEAVITGSDYTTPMGLRVGMNLDEVRALYNNKGYYVSYNPEEPEDAYINGDSEPWSMTDTDYCITLSLKDSVVVSMQLYYVWPG